MTSSPPAQLVVQVAPVIVQVPERATVCAGELAFAGGSDRGAGAWIPMAF